MTGGDSLSSGRKERKRERRGGWAKSRPNGGRNAGRPTAPNRDAREVSVNPATDWTRGSPRDLGETGLGETDRRRGNPDLGIERSRDQARGGTR